MKHIWSVLCSLSIRDAERNNFSLIEIPEQIIFAAPETDEVKGLPVQFDMVSAWWRTDVNQPEQRSGKIILASPENVFLLETTFDVNLSEFKRARSITRFPGLPFTVNGIYTFVVQMEEESEWDTVATIPLELIRDISS